MNRILARWCSLGVLGAGLVPGAAGAAAPASSLESLGSAYRESPTPSRKAALVRYAGAHPKDQNGTLARLVLGVQAFEEKSYPAAIVYLKAAQPHLTQLADYVAYYLAAAHVESGEPGAVAEEVAKVTGAPVASPLASRALIVEARALTASGKADRAVRLLLEHYAGLSQPDGDLALAMAYEASQDLQHAATFYQQVYYQHPTSEAANKSAAALLNLRGSMGAAFPQPSPQQMLERGNRLLEAGECLRARAEFAFLAPQLSGIDRDMARVGMGAADYLQGNLSAAYTYLRSLETAESEAGAERLYYLTECARKLSDDDEMMAHVSRLAKAYPRSQWYFRALVTAGTRFVLAHEPEKYEPLFKVAGRMFPSEPQAAVSHWKYCWVSYLHRKDDAAERLREHLNLYALHPTASGALYYLGRLSEADQDYGAARAYYRKLADLFPNYYYGLLGRERLAFGKIAAATPPESVQRFLAGVLFPDKKLSGQQAPSAATALRIERSRLLRSAGLADWAQSELRYGARTDGQAGLLAVEMARSAGSPHQALRSMKSLAPDNLQMSFEDAPPGFWDYLFPMPYRGDLVRNARQQNLDPFVLAGLIRQESEFDPQALSYAKAYGLTQVRPATGRALARRAGMRFSNRVLFQPAANLKLGTMYLRSLLDQWGGKWEEALAAYNAGPSRAKEWMRWADFREPSEFVETIPFTQTREYVQAVLRNAALYRRIYENRLEEPEPPQKKAKPATKVARSRPTPHKKVATKRRPRANS